MAKITYSPHPLLPSKDRKTFEVENKTVLQVLEDINSDREVSVYVNGHEVSKDLVLKENDIVNIRAMVRGGGGQTSQTGKILTTILQVALIVTLTVLSAGTATPLVLALVAVGGSLLIAGVRALFAIDNSNDPGGNQSTQKNANLPNHSLSASSNKFRPYQPLPLVLSSLTPHRFHPDFGALPYRRNRLVESDDIGVSLELVETTVNIQASLSWVKYNYVNPRGVGDILPGCDPITGGGGPGIRRYWLPVYLGDNTNNPPHNPYVQPQLIDDITVNLPGDAPWGIGSRQPTHESLCAAKPFSIDINGDPGVRGGAGIYVGWFRYDVNDACVITNCDFASLGYYYNGSPFCAVASNGSIIDIQSNWNLSGVSPLDPSVRNTAYINGQPPFLADCSENPNFEGFVETQFPACVYVETITGYAGCFTEVRHIFNYGFGDLDTDYIDPNKDDDVSYWIGHTNLERYRGTKIFKIQKQPNEWNIEWDNALSRDCLTENPASDDYGSKIENIEIGIHGNVHSEQGGILRNNEEFNLTNPGQIAQETVIGLVDSGDFNWVRRESPYDNIVRIEIDLQGRAFIQDRTAGIINTTIPLEVQWKDINAATWNYFDHPTTNAAFNFTGDYSNTVCCTIVQDDLPPGHYEVRVRRVIRDESKDQDQNRRRNKISEINFTEVKFFRQDQIEDGGLNEYVAQHRLGVIIQASDQLQGRLQSFNSLVRNKTWVFDGANWTWGYSDNPASHFLYFALGGFKTYFDHAAETFPNSPTIGWTTSIEHPESEERLFGAGLPIKQIDLDSIQEWYTYCDNADLRFNAILHDSANVMDVLGRIAAVGRGSVTWCKGKLGVIWENENDIPVGVVSHSNVIKDSFNISYINRELPDFIEVRYTDCEDHWTQRSVQVIRPFVNPNNAHKRAVIDYWGIIRRGQAQREANLIAAKQFFQRRTITFSMDIESLFFCRGDVVYISHNLVCWSESGRITDVEIEGGKITKIYACNPHADHTTMMIRHPNGEIYNYSVTPSDGFYILNEEWLAENGPEIYQECLVNDSTQFKDSEPCDWIYFVGNTTTPYKKVRITSISANDFKQVQISAIDEEDAYYAQEFNLDLDDNDIIDYTIIPAKVECASVKQQDGIAKIFFELDGTSSVRAEINVDNSGYIPLIGDGGATYYGGCIELDQYVSGQEICLKIIPLVIGIPSAVEDLEICFTME